MEAAHLRDITGVTQQPWARKGGGGGSLPHKFGLPFAGDEIQSHQLHRESTRAGGGNFVSAEIFWIQDYPRVMDGLI